MPTATTAMSMSAGLAAFGAASTMPPRSRSRLAVAAALAAALALSACVSGPEVGSRGGEPGPVGKGPQSAFEAAQLQRAQDQAKDGDLAEAAMSWEVLTVLRPDNTGYRDSLAATRQLIDGGVAERLQKGQQAQKRGDLDGATAQYLQALALQPDNGPAADALRSIEKDRNRKSYLGTPSRITLRKATPATVPTPKAAAAAKAQPAPDRNELEHIAMLAAQGEVDEPIRLLEKRTPQDRADPSARRLLADLYVRKAEKVAASDKAGAMGWLQKCLKVDPKHARATALMRQWIDEAAGKGGGAGTAARDKR
ncbi:tetratricopeptide repeat protein [Roseateles aquatilis]|nr:hypothetical protein [Roseateles aquatilis]